MSTSTYPVDIEMQLVKTFITCGFLDLTHTAKPKFLALSSKIYLTFKIFEIPDFSSKNLDMVSPRQFLYIYIKKIFKKQTERYILASSYSKVCKIDGVTNLKPQGFLYLKREKMVLLGGEGWNGTIHQPP